MNNMDHSFVEYLSDKLAVADDTYAQLPDDVMLQAQNLANDMMDYAQRQLQLTGPGIEQYDTREYRLGIDDPRKISQKLSARLRKAFVIERQAEIRQPVFLWRKGTGSMNVQYGPDSKRLTKKEYADVVLLAASMAISASEDRVGVLEGEGTYHGPQAIENIAAHFFDANIIAGKQPFLNQLVPVGSNVIIVSDFFFDNTEEQNEFINSIELLKGLGVNGQAYMLIDPEELDFPFEGYNRFKGFSSDVTEDRQKAESLRDEFKLRMNDHIAFVSNVFHQSNFEFNLYRTDTQPVDVLFNIFEVTNSPNALGFQP